MNDACESVGVKLIHRLPYRPQGQGPVERANRTIKILLIKLFEMRFILNGSKLGIAGLTDAVEEAEDILNTEFHLTPMHEPCNLFLKPKSEDLLDEVYCQHIGLSDRNGSKPILKFVDEENDFCYEEVGTERRGE